eukprot:s126_g4.t1
MASLEAAASVKLADGASADTGKNAKNRVVADPLVTAKEVADVILGYFQFKKTKDLWPLLARANKLQLAHYRPRSVVGKDSKLAV